MNFQVGDTVRRIKGEHNGMEIGDIATVKEIETLGSFYLVDYPGIGGHFPEYFELASPGIFPPSKILFEVKQKTT